MNIVDARPPHAEVVNTNVASIRVLEKCGFTQVEPHVGDDGVEELVLELPGLIRSTKGEPFAPPLGPGLPAHVSRTQRPALLWVALQTTGSRQYSFDPFEPHVDLAELVSRRSVPIPGAISMRERATKELVMAAVITVRNPIPTSITNAFHTRTRWTIWCRSRWVGRM